MTEYDRLLAGASKAELRRVISEIKERLGSRLLILAHHFQNADVLAAAHMRGSSFELAKTAAESQARYVVFCGAHFMAQSAALLARHDQTVFHPNPLAGCPMADMVNAADMARAYDQICRVQRGRHVVPITYMNALADVQAFVGKHGGTILTSNNEQEVFRWAYEQADTIFFVPDENVGRGAAIRSRLLQQRDIVVFDPKRGDLGGLTERELEKARLILWPGHCPIHVSFTVEHVDAARKRWPNAKIAAHNEVTVALAGAVDVVGGTTALMDLAMQGNAAGPLVLATERDLVKRWAVEFNDINIVPLHSNDVAVCPDMARLTFQDLAETLIHLPHRNAVRLSEELRIDGSKALSRMFQISKPRIVVDLDARFEAEAESLAALGFVPTGPAAKPIDGKIRDLSETGLFIESTGVLPPRTQGRVYLRIPEGEGKLEIKATVRWATDLRGNKGPGMGVEFTDLSPHEKALLKTFVDVMRSSRPTSARRDPGLD